MSEKVKPSKEFADPKKNIIESDGFITAATSAGGNKIQERRILSSDPNSKNILLIGGVHGNESEGVSFMVEFCRNVDFLNIKHNLCLVPVLNPDGMLAHERRNANGVDLNRNLPTKDWTSKVAEEKYFPGTEACSEPENKYLIELINDFKPDFIISFHSWKPMINMNGPAEKFAEVMRQYLNMIITDDIGYPTPGSLGTYTGWERKIPTITLEFERGVELESIYPYAKEGILASFDVL